MILWRHRIDDRDVVLNIALSSDNVSVTVRVVGVVNGTSIDHTDARRIIPADLVERRIVLDELRVILGNALDSTDTSDQQFARIARNIRKNFLA